MTGYIPLSTLDLALAAILVLLNGAVSLAYGLKLEKSLAVASLRMVVQLAAVALVLRFIFAETTPLWSIAFAMLMAAACCSKSSCARPRVSRAGRRRCSALRPPFCRASRRRSWPWPSSSREPWYAPRFLLPILGMLVGNALTGVGLVLDTMTSAARRERASSTAAWRSARRDLRPSRIFCAARCERR